MENASKALLIAGGILIALLIIGALVLMFNQIGDYEKGQQSNEKNSQLAQFNLDFERYMDDNGITGADVISLINKVINYNKKAKNGGVNNSVDYSIKMSITVSGFDEFNEQYAYNVTNIDKKYIIFTQNLYTIGDDNDNLTNSLKSDLDEANKLETDICLTKDQLKQLSEIYNKSDKEESIKKINEKYKELTNSSNNILEDQIDAIIKYRQYWEFKTSKFKPVDNPEYENGQIKSMKFKFVK